MEWLEITAVHISVDRYQPFNPTSGVVYVNYQVNQMVKDANLVAIIADSLQRDARLTVQHIVTIDKDYSEDSSLDNETDNVFVQTSQ